MKKVRPVTKKFITKTRLVHRDQELPSVNKPSLKEDGSIYMDEMEQLKELHSIDIIRSNLKAVLKLRNKAAIRSLLDQIREKLELYSKDLDEIGDGYASKQARKMGKEIPKLIDMMEKGANVFFPAYRNFIEKVEEIDPSRKTSLKEAISYDFEKNMDEFKNIKDVHIQLGDSKGIIVDVPISLVLFKPVSDANKVLLEKRGVKFAKGMGMVLIPNAQFFALNKNKFRGNYQTTISMAISAISKNNTRFVPLQNIYKETDNAYCVFVVPEKMVHFYNNLFTSANKINIHLK